ncbi:coil containing protein [Vibrio phage 1.244.A._10N.261.54.C3]|nr:coil containing protein [Vibrio phage 1.244.A._10N.261.54.C3]AUR98786.1 coil containing protein [Vibrio phage 1.255.O._10N.286.45.F1]
MEIITKMSGYRLSSPFPKPQVGEVHCVVQLKDGELILHTNKPIVEVAESTNSNRVWSVSVGVEGQHQVEFLTIGTVSGYVGNMSITCTESRIKAAENLLDNYALVQELSTLRMNRSKLRQSQTSVKLLSSRIESRKELKDANL